MIVRCDRRRMADLACEEQSYCQQFIHLDEVDLVVGQEYLVFGQLKRNGRPWFLICENETDSYPKPHYAGFFEVVDSRIPPDWTTGPEDGNAGPFALLPTAWASNPRFLENLIDGEAGATSIFEAVKEHLKNWHGRADAS